MTLNLFRGASRAVASALPRFTYVQMPHIKLKAEHQALVLFHIVKIALAYWEGWRDGSRQRREKNEVGEKGRSRGKRHARRFAGKGKYTVVFQ